MLAFSATIGGAMAARGLNFPSEGGHSHVVVFA
jgi:hypothetical protein